MRIAVHVGTCHWLWISKHPLSDPVVIRYDPHTPSKYVRDVI